MVLGMFKWIQWVLSYPSRDTLTIREVEEQMEMVGKCQWRVEPFFEWKPSKILPGQKENFSNGFRWYWQSWNAGGFGGGGGGNGQNYQSGGGGELSGGWCKFMGSVTYG